MRLVAAYRSVWSFRLLAVRWLAVTAVVAACLASTAVASAEANDHGPAVHEVYRGQTLGMIARRYRVSVAAICHANAMQASHPIKPGDRLVIPAVDDEDGSEARKRRSALLGRKGSGSSGQEIGSKRRASNGRGKPRVHKVYRGQTLGMIAKRYHVTVDAIAHANAMRRSDPIKPGDELVIPAPGDEDGSAARRARAELLDEAQGSHGAPEEKPRVHRVYRGHTLGKIAARYHVSVQALCRANDITRSTPIKPGQRLVVPAPGDDDGSAARAWRLRRKRGHHDDRPSDKSWRDYEKPAWRRGYITLQSPSGDKRWSGYVIGPGNKLLPLAREKVSDVLASWRTGKQTSIHPRLVRLIAQVSDTFGGRTIRVVSGFREHSHSKRSRHPEGRALDFSIHGVPNWAVRDYLRRLSAVGVGYYPNSSFVHLDVRDESTYWVDVSGPGQAPRYVHISHGRKR